MRCLGWLLVIVVAVQAVQAQAPVARFERLSVEQGLSNARVNDIVQDQQGFLWIATEHGLNKYDGYQFAVYEHEPHEAHSLAASWIRHLYEDQEGTLWIVPFVDGLTRFDASTGRFQHFVHDPANPHSVLPGQVLALASDGRGRLWVGTEAGLQWFDTATGRFERLDTTPAFGDVTVTTLHADRAGALWVGTAQGLYRVDPTRTRLERPSHDGAVPQEFQTAAVRCFFEDHAGVLWVGTAAGLLRVDPGTQEAQRMRVQGSGAARLDQADIPLIYEAPKQPGTLWIGTQGGGLDRLEVATGITHHYAANFSNPTVSERATLRSPMVQFVQEDRTGQMWVGTNAGLHYLDRTTDRFTVYRFRPDDAWSLSHPNVRMMYEDRSGVLWVGTAGGGLSKLNPRQQRFAHHFYDPRYRGLNDALGVTALHEQADGTRWIGTTGYGLVRYEPATGDSTWYQQQTAAPHHLSHNFVTDLYASPATPGILWVGTYGGLHAIDLRTGHRTQTPTATGTTDLFIRSLHEGPNGLLWVGTSGRGVGWLNDTTGRITYIPCGSETAQSLRTCDVLTHLVDAAGTVWIGTVAQGLHRYDPATGLVTRYHERTEGNGQPPGSILAFAEGPSGTLWIGGYSSGLTHFDPATGRFRNYTRRDGMPSNQVLDLQVDANGHIWASTDRGLARFDPVTETVRTFDVDDGLQSNQFSRNASAKGNDGTLLFGGIDGINRFHPDSLDQQAPVPPVVLTALQVRTAAGETRTVLDPARHTALHLNHRDREISFEFAALDFTNPKKNQYAYRLDGVDETWVEAGTRRFGSYTNLAPGQYTLQVKGANSDGVWNEVGTTLALTITPPFWQTWWFYGLSGAGVLLLMGLVHAVRVRAEAQRQVQLERVRTAEHARVRKKAAKDFHDELGHLATKITLFGEILRRNPDGAYLDRIIGTSKRLSSGMGDFIWTLDPERETLMDVVVRLKDFGDELFSNTGIAFRVDGLEALPANLRLPMDWRRHLTLLFKEGMHNALKHARCTQVDLQVTCTDRHLTLSLSDDGVGFDQAETPTGQGRGNMRSRAEALGGTFLLETAPGAGTTLGFSGRLPEDA